MIFLQPRQRFLGQSLRSQAVPLMKHQEVVDEWRYIFAASPEWRQRDSDHVEAMQQILPDLPCLDEFIDVPVRRHQNTDINLEAPHASHTAHLATVQHLQELALHLGRHVRELVEKERAAIGELE